MDSGIYSLTNARTGKRYIGRTLKFTKRQLEHFSALRNGRHPNNHLQRAWDLGDRFEFEIIERCEPDKLNEREIYWIAYYDSFHNGYNQCEGGATTQGYHFSEETKRKISMKNKGRKCDPEVVQRRKDTLKRHLQEDPEFARRYRENLSKASKGKPSWNKGIPCSEEKKKLLSEKMKGRYVSEEHKEKLRSLYSGENSITAKLSKNDVVEIRCRFLSGERQIDIVKDYPVTPQTIYDIVHGRRWKSVPMTLEELQKLKERED